MKKAYPFQDLSTPELSGEVWKDIPNSLGHYQISSKGRVRRLAHQRTNKLGIASAIPALIICQQVAKSYNAFTQDYRFYLRFSITVNGKRFGMNTARLMYYCFVAPFDLKDMNLVVLYQDDDSLNVSPDNLYLSDAKGKFDRMVSKQRWAGTVGVSKTGVKSHQNPASGSSANPATSIVSKYDFDGKLIQTYEDASLAAAGVNVSESHIKRVAKGNKHKLTAGGYLWRLGDAPTIDIAAIKDRLVALRAGGGGANQTPIGQYDLSGNLISTFPSVQAACRHLGISSSSSIRAVIAGSRLTSKGYLWRQGNLPKISVDKKIIALQKGAVVEKKSPSAKKNPVVSKITQYNLDGIRIRTFVSINEASRETGASRSSIQRVLSGKYITAGGTLWQQGDALRIDLKPFKQFPGFAQSTLGIYQQGKREKNLEKISDRVVVEDSAGVSHSVANLLEKAEAKGVEKGKVQVLRNLIRDFGFTNEQAASALEVSVAFVEEVYAAQQEEVAD